MYYDYITLTKYQNVTAWCKHYIRMSLPGVSTIIVTSKVTRHKYINTTCMILQGYALDSFVQHWCGQKRRLLNTTTSVRIWGGGGSAQSYNNSQAVTLPVCLCNRKVAPIKLMENPSP